MMSPMTAEPQREMLSLDSHLIGVHIDEAAGVADLQAAAGRVDELVRLLHGSGTRVERVMRLVSDLNTRIFARLWSLVAPAELVANSCLLAMGSEGRGEQILRTDQDNALLLRDGFAFGGSAAPAGAAGTDLLRDLRDLPDLPAVAARFNAALVQLGWPPCPGDIMLTNPLWRQPLASFRETMRDWIYGADPEGPMHLAIFFDAAAKAGDATLLTEARDHLDRILSGSDSFLARFAAAADQFQEPGNWLSRLVGKRDEQPLDLKKLGTFPIVHGVRALSLKYGVRAPGTVDRLAALAAAGRLDEALARELGDALHLLIGIRLTHQLKQRERGQPVGNEVRPSDLSTLEREPLHDALAIVKRFRLFLRQHFRFDTL
ncbi:MAG: signal transduction protein [Burkholderiales bacterium]|nr:signal transduction protein [Burkholderiales bacterium]